MLRAFLALMALVSGSVLAGPFGRFGYRPLPMVPGFDLSSDGIRAKHERSDWLLFPVPLRLTKAVEVSDKRFTALCRFAPGGPDKIRVNLLSPGFEAHFPQGMRITLKTAKTPILSWPGASVGPGVPTAPSRWVVLSMGSDQPPVLVASLGDPVSFRVEEVGGALLLVSGREGKGWFRFCLPTGLQSVPAESVGDFSTLVASAAKHEALWVSKSPQVTGTNWMQAGDALTVTWKLDQPIAVAPSPMAFRPEISNDKLVQTGTHDEHGPVAYVTNGQLSATFRPRRLPLGAPIFQLSPDLPPLIGSDPFDAKGILRLAAGGVIRGHDPLWQRMADGTYNDYVLSAPYRPEPWTRQMMPYHEKEGVDACAAQALLGQALQSVNGSTSPENALLTSLFWRMDWRTWTIDGLNEIDAVCCASAWNPSVTVRTQGAMLGHGLGRDPLQNWLGPMIEIARSPLRQTAGPALRLHAFGSAWKLSWDGREGPQRIEMLSSAPLRLLALSNLQNLRVEEQFGTVTLTGTAPSSGECSVRLIWPSWAPALPVLR
jgi:hypothetical protein